MCKIIYRVLRLSRFKQATIKRFLSSISTWITGRRLVIHSMKRSTWVWDRHEMVLHACFQLLTDYIECEIPDEWINWNSDPAHAHAWSEMTDLYNWWKGERPDRLDPLDSIDREPGLGELFSSDRDQLRIDYPEYFAALDESSRMDLLWEEEDQDNLHRLITIRNFMWT